MAKRTTRIGKTVVKGATDADKQTIAAAKAVNRAETKKVVQRNEDTAEAKKTVSAKKTAAARQFAEADKAVDIADNEAADETRIRLAVRGY